MVRRASLLADANYAVVRLAEVVDEGQANGEVTTKADGRPRSTRTSGTSTLPELGLSSQRLAEARVLARAVDAETDRRAASGPFPSSGFSG